MSTLQTLNIPQQLEIEIKVSLFLNLRLIGTFNHMSTRLADKHASHCATAASNDMTNHIHVAFCPRQDLDRKKIESILSQVHVPEFRPSNKVMLRSYGLCDFFFFLFGMNVDQALMVNAYIVLHGYTVWSVLEDEVTNQ